MKPGRSKLVSPVRRKRHDLVFAAFVTIAALLICIYVLLFPFQAELWTFALQLWAALFD